MALAGTRRSVLTWALGLATTAACQSRGRHSGAQGRSLSGAAALSARFSGAAVRVENIDDDPSFRQAVLDNCSYLTPELVLKWEAIEAVRGQLSLASLDELTSFARRNNMNVYGHTLLWHRSVPDWANVLLEENKDWGLIERHFSSIMPRYGDVIQYWDVVNEPIQTGFRLDGLRENIFLKAFGPSYIHRALSEARLNAPNAKLMINEFGLEYDLAVEDDRRYLLLKLIENIKNSGAPLDGIGVQAHLDLRKGSVSRAKFSRFLNELSSFGMQIVITELDVKERDYAASVGRRDQEVGDEVRRFMDIVLEQPAVKGVTTWGLSDRYSWLQVTEDDLAAYANAGKDGAGPGLNRGLPLDASMRPKPMYEAILSAFNQAR